MYDLDTQPDRRWALRRIVDLDADVTDAAGQSHAVRVTEISEEGCAISINSGCDLERDRLQTIKISGLDPIDAYVIWTKNGRAGLNLSRPLDAATIQRLTVKSLYARLDRSRAASGQSSRRLESLRPFPFD